MAVVWNPCSAKGRGEQRLAALLESFDDEKLRLCFSVDFIPGGREIDLLLIDLDLGVFIIEVKAVPLSAFVSVSPNEWKIKGRDGTESPLRQAYGQFEGLRSYWDGRMKSRLPKICTTACLPEISRYEWLRAFTHDPYATTIASGLLFREDLLDAGTLNERLLKCMLDPPMRTGFKPFPPNQNFLIDFQQLLEPSVPQVATNVDRQRLQAIENVITKQMLEEFPVGGSAFSVFTGNPGTGKTFRLLSIGLSHAYGNKKVLFACFNKTLASDIRRLLSFNEKLKHVSYPVNVVDVYQLAKRSFELNGYPRPESGNPDQWGEMVVKQLRDDFANAIIDTFDTILVDEAHDLMDWQLDLIRLHAAPGATVCLALGKGQELYRDDSSALNWLEGMSSGKKIIRRDLRRNFRNTQAQYYAALAFHKAWPNKLQEVDLVHKSVFEKKHGNRELEFDRQGEPLSYIPIPTLQGEFADGGRNQTELVTAEYLEILQDEIQSIDNDGNAHPVGLLVLVPDANSQHAICVREALKMATSNRPDWSFIDYTDDEKRRTTALSSEIRLCTFHSSRGLEGERVIVFGLEQIASFAERTHVKAENLGFIALSRGVFRTVVVVRSHFVNETHALLKKILITHSGTSAH